MKNYIRFIIFAFFFTAALAQAQPIAPMIYVDTLCNLWKGQSGQAGGAHFLPDGNIYSLWRGRPLIIDSKTGEIIRWLDALPSGFAAAPKVSSDGTRLVTKVTGPKLAIWDVPTGKIIKQFEFEITYFCLSPDGSKLYISLPNKTEKPGLIAIYDMKTLEEIERLSYSGLSKAYSIDITPDGQTLAVVVEKYIDSQTSYIQIVLITLNDKKNYSLVESSDDGFMSIQFSPDGKQIASLHEGGNPSDLFIFIYNIETKEKKYIRSKELETLFGGINIAAINKPQFIDANNIYTGFVNNWGYVRYSFAWNIPENRIKRYIDFDGSESLDIKDSTLIFCNYGGLIGFCNINAVSVQDNLIFDNTLITYSNNQLEFNSEEAFSGTVQIYDLSGKLVADLGTQMFSVGRNIIPINQTLPTGVYILTIINGDERISGKFMVE